MHSCTCYSFSFQQHYIVCFIRATTENHNSLRLFAICNVISFHSLEWEIYGWIAKVAKSEKFSLSPSDLHFHFELIVVHFNLLSLPAAVIALRRLKFEYSLIFFFLLLTSARELLQLREKCGRDGKKNYTRECETEREIFVSSSECKLWNSLILLIQQIYSGFCATFPSFVVRSRASLKTSPYDAPGNCLWVYMEKKFMRMFNRMFCEFRFPTHYDLTQQHNRWNIHILIFSLFTVLLIQAAAQESECGGDAPSRFTFSSLIFRRDGKEEARVDCVWDDDDDDENE